MFDFKILFLTNNKNLFDRISNELERDLLRSNPTIHSRFELGNIEDTIEIMMEDIELYDLIIVDTNREFLSQYQILSNYDSLLKEFQRKIILLQNKQLKILVKDPLFSSIRFVKYDEVKELKLKLRNIIRNSFIHSDYFLSNDLLKDTSRAELLLKEKEHKIKELEAKSHDTQMKGVQAIKEKELLQEEANKLKEKIALLEEEKQKETDDIEKIISFLAAMPQEISKEQSYLENRRKRFTIFGGSFLSFSALLALGLIANVLFGNILGLPIIDKLSHYLAYALTIGFPMGISLLFYRQANLKSKEIEKINEKSILVQQVENALNSYNVLLSGDELKEKTISSIDRVIDKVFENNKAEKQEKVEENKLSISDIQKIFKIGNDITKG